MTRAVVSLEDSPVPASSPEDGTAPAAAEEAASCRSESLSPPRTPMPEDSEARGGSEMLKNTEGLSLSQTEHLRKVRFFGLISTLLTLIRLPNSIREYSSSTPQDLVELFIVLRQALLRIRALHTKYHSPLYSGLRYLIKVGHAADGEDLSRAAVVGVLVRVRLRQKTIVGAVLAAITITALTSELSGSTIQNQFVEIVQTS